eukprot:TRINITY_DN1736_c0_g1_i5.p1 TRINITY_DN1736_c0_g1~~TRINITY_DN1736_c0_g1_i5.p1  ORF type:complete len:643 (-),score=114.93 TRINITY_DN1736_c0_g1_i5:241-2169(-)
MPLALFVAFLCVACGGSVPLSDKESEAQCALQFGRKQQSDVEASEQVNNRRSAPARRFWRQVSQVSDDMQHELVFMIGRDHKSLMHNELMDRSMPGKFNFRKWMSRSDVHKLTENAASMSTVRRVLDEAGVSSLREVGQTFLKASARVAVWRKLLDTDFFRYSRLDGQGVERVRADSYLLPHSLTDHVGGILKLLQLDESPSQQPSPMEKDPAEAHQKISFPNSPERVAPKTSADRRLKGAGPGGCHGSLCPSIEALDDLLGGQLVTPDRLRAAYNMKPVAASGSEDAKKRANITQLVFASLEQSWSPNDRQAFQTAFDLPLQAVSDLSEVGLHGNSQACDNDLNNCIEANLDVQYMNAMSPWSNLTFYYMDLNGQQEFDDFVVQLLDLDPVPTAVSISYGMLEVGASQDSVDAFDDVMMQLGLQGGTIFVSSGDDGAAGNIVRQYGCAATALLGLQVSWPASSAYVTSVGATMGVGTSEPEVACSTNGETSTFQALKHKPLITTGGGFAQKEAVPEWQTGLPAGAQGRGVPDVSLAGHAYAIVVGGYWLTVDGTSASSPAFAGMISLINAERKAQGKPTLGFLNPSLYANPHAFRDITEGDNKCAASGAPCCGGYEAGPGWDAATGLGVPNFAELFDALTK